MASKANKTEGSKRMCASCVKETLFNESKWVFICQKYGIRLYVSQLSIIQYPPQVLAHPLPIVVF